MKIRGLMTMLIILLGLSAFVYFYEIRGGRQREEQEKAEKRLFQVAEADIQEVTLVAGEGEIRGVRETDKWRIVRPFDAEADQYQWNSIARSLADLSMDKQLEDTSELANFGLDRPRIRVVLKDREGQEYQLEFGSENPTSSFVYTKSSQKPNVLLVPTTAYRVFDRKFFDLRDRSVLKAETSEVREINLRNPTGSLVLQKAGDEWQIKSPIEAKADNSEVSSFLSGITGGLAKEFIDEPPADLDTGLDRAAYDLTLVTGEDRAIRHLRIGNQRPPEASTAGETETTPEATFFARDDSRSALMVVDKFFVERLDKGLSNFRDKTIVKIDRENLSRIEIAFGDEAISLVKSGEEWRTPDGLKKAKEDLLSSLLSAVEYRKAQRILDPPINPAELGLDTPDAKIVFEHANLAKQELWLGKDDGEGLYAKLVGEPHVKVLEKDIREKIKLKSADLLVDPESK